MEGSRHSRPVEIGAVVSEREGQSDELSQAAGMINEREQRAREIDTHILLV
jgi:hypothetical protein